MAHPNEDLVRRGYDASRGDIGTLQMTGGTLYVHGDAEDRV